MIKGLILLQVQLLFILALEEPTVISGVVLDLDITSEAGF